MKIKVFSTTVQIEEWESRMRRLALMLWEQHKVVIEYTVSQNTDHVLIDLPQVKQPKSNFLSRMKYKTTTTSINLWLKSQGCHDAKVVIEND